MTKKVLTLLTISCLLCCCFPLIVNADAHWLENFDYRVLFYWESSHSGQDSFTVYNQTGFSGNSKFYIDNETKPDFSDLRVTRSDGTTLLNMQNLSITEQVSAEILVNFPVANASYYLYWGNSDASKAWINVYYDIIDNLVGCWLLNETGNTDPALDYSGNSNTGTATGTTAVASPFFYGRTARSFDGSTSYITLNDIEAMQIYDKNVSIAAYVTLNQYTAGQWRMILGGENGALGLGVGWGTQVLRATKCNTADFPNGPAYTLNENKYVGLSFDTSSVAMNANYFVDSTTSTVNFNNDFTSGSASMFIGCLNVGLSGKWNGTISGLYVFNSVLSAEEHANLAAHYGDPTIEAGKIVVRDWMVNNGITLVGNFETSPYADELLVEDAVGIAVVFGVLAIAVAVVFAAKSKS